MKKHYQCRASNECCAFVNNSAELAKIRCQACRFRKCIDAGMKIDGKSVLYFAFTISLLLN